MNTGHHDNATSFQPDEEDALGFYAIAEMAVRELLCERGVIEAEEMRRALEWYDQVDPGQGAAIVARAWSDAQFKERLINQPMAVMGDYGIPMGHVELYVVENTPQLHNVVVCTLCSCYPRALLGIPPDWYKSRSYRARVVAEPRAVLAEFGTIIPDSKAVRVHDSTADLRYLVLPERPAATQGWDVAALEGLVTRDTMIGVTVPVVGSGS